MGDPWEKPPDLYAELGLPQMWPKLGSKPQQWDDERFWVLKISIFNHSAIKELKACKSFNFNQSNCLNWK